MARNTPANVARAAVDRARPTSCIGARTYTLPDWPDYAKRSSVSQTYTLRSLLLSARLRTLTSVRYRVGSKRGYRANRCRTTENLSRNVKRHKKKAIDTTAVSVRVHSNALRISTDVSFIMIRNIFTGAAAIHVEPSTLRTPSTVFYVSKVKYTNSVVKLFIMFLSRITRLTSTRRAVVFL